MSDPTSADAWQTWLPEVRRIARSAGDAIMAIYAGDIEVEFKDDRSPLTAADRAAHELIVAGLRSLTPDVPVWSEESAAIPARDRLAWTRFWLVDPLDGTREFIRRNGEFTVNIAFVENHAPVLGVVLAPALGREYFAVRDRGAWRADGAAAARPVRVAALGSPVRVAGSRSHRGSSLDAFLQALGPHELLPMGSSLKFCLVAEGAADVYPRLGPTSGWDTAAAHAVLEAAGGHVVDLDGHPLRYNTRTDALNPDFVAFGDPGGDWLRLLGASRPPPT